jgi:hypothetical protein
LDSLHALLAQLVTIALNLQQPKFKCFPISVQLVLFVKSHAPSAVFQPFVVSLPTQLLINNPEETRAVKTVSALKEQLRNSPT